MVGGGGGAETCPARCRAEPLAQEHLESAGGREGLSKQAGPVNSATARQVPLRANGMMVDGLEHGGNQGLRHERVCLWSPKGMWHH